MQTILDNRFRDWIGRIDPQQRVFVCKKWGWEELVANSDYCLKTVFCKQGKTCEWHYHNKKDSTLLLISGELLVDYSTDDCLFDDKLFIAPLGPAHKEVDRELVGYSILKPGDTFHIPAHIRHRFTTLQDATFIEVATCEEDNDTVVVCENN